MRLQCVQNVREAVERISRSAPFMVMVSLVVVACDRNPYDAAQRPRVTIGSATAPVVISWQPAGAQLVRVYRGSAAGDGYTTSLMWSITASSMNSLLSGVSYGAVAPGGGTTDVAARPLVTGERYTVQVTRQDPKGSGDGFTNTRNRYVGTLAFTLWGGATSVTNRVSR